MAELPTDSEKMEPELIIKGEPIDYEISELLGEKPGDFLVLCFDGVQFERFGTPSDSPAARKRKSEMVDYLNDRSKDSWWPELWKNWAGEIRAQYGLPPETGPDDYRPLVSYKISRVVAGRSKYLHCAIRLFEEIDEKLKTWSVRKLRNGEPKHLVEIVTIDDRPILESGDDLPLVICKAIRRVLKASPSNDPDQRPGAKG